MRIINVHTLFHLCKQQAINQINKYKTLKIMPDHAREAYCLY